MTTQSLTPGLNTLQYETATFARNSWGPIERNRSNGEQGPNDGRPLTLNGKVYAQGYGVHAGSEMRFSLKGTDGAQCTRFTVDVGIDDEVGDKGSVGFQVLVDGVVKTATGVMRGDSPTQQIDMDITGAEELTLLVTSTGDGIHYDHADWADPKIYCDKRAPVPVQMQMSLASSELTMFHKFSASLNATFSSSSQVTGPLVLRLEQADPRRGLPIGHLELPTTSVPFTGPGSAAHSITVSAPGGLSNCYSDDPATYPSPDRLIASVGGKDVATALLTITVKPLDIKAHFEPASLSGRDGDIKTVTVVVTVTPPLPAMVPIRVGFASGSFYMSDFMEIKSTGAARGDGGQMRDDTELQFFDKSGNHIISENVQMVVEVGEIESRYPRPGYGTNGFLTAPLSLQLLC